MKKALALVVLIVTPYIVFAQGTVVFSNSTSGLVKQWTSYNDSSLTPVPYRSGYVQLIGAPVGTAFHPLGSYQGSFGFYPFYPTLTSFLAANPGWNVTEPPELINIAPGIFSGGTVTIPLIGEGADAEYVVIGWSGVYAAYDAAFAAGAFLGQSPVAITATGDPLLTPPGTPVSLSITFAGITLAPVISIPEPSTFELAGLGAVLLFLFRRLIIAKAQN
jgi:hypothetical protein